MKNIAVVMGGFSAEKVISLKSGKVALNFLDKDKYNAFAVIIDNEGWRLEKNGKSYPINKSNFSVNIDNQMIKFDGVFMAIHGTPGENGVLQKYFDKLKIPYTCSGAKASALSFDKGACNEFLRNFDIPCAKSIKLKKGNTINYSKIIKQLKLPCFVKPNSNGSSFGITKVKSFKELMPAIKKAFMHDKYILIESLLIGTEVTCGAHNLNGTVETFPITEIVSENDFFDFEAKYEGKSKEITPARISDELAKKVSERTIEIYQLLELNGIARIDFIIMNNEPYIIEANTVPGLSEESIIPQQAHCHGISLSELFNQSVEYMFQGK